MDYTFPVDQLLTQGPVQPSDTRWSDYARLGIGPEHAGQLRAMMLDVELQTADDDRCWAPLHAWRALAQTGAPIAAQSYIDMLLLLERLEDYDGDWEWEDAESFFATVGPPAIDPLVHFFHDQAHSVETRAGVPQYLAAIAAKHAEARQGIVATLAAFLERAAENDRDLNGWLVAALVRLEATEAGGIIDKAFADKRVNPAVCGNWEAVAYDLGLRDTPPPSRRYDWAFPGGDSAPRDAAQPDAAQAKKKNKNRARAKMARASRKRNRR